jgi:hypothetical protein
MRTKMKEACCLVEEVEVDNRPLAVAVAVAVVVVEKDDQPFLLYV